MRATLRLTLATRGSRLALVQSQWVADRLQEAHPDLEVRLETIVTTGDRSAEVPLPGIGGTGLFTREIEQALLDRRADLAVHSLKDLPIASRPGLTLAALTERVDPRDVLVTGSGQVLDDLPAEAVIGTSSPRRIAQLLHHRPDLVFAPMRGNVDTRLRKLRDQNLAGIVLAGAGLLRLGLSDRITQWLPPSVCLPAPGQGILAIQVREEDAETIRLTRPLASAESWVCATAERAALQGLGGGCQTPAGFLAVMENDRCILQGVVVGIQGEPYVRGEICGGPHEAVDLGRRLADMLLARGADRLLS